LYKFNIDPKAITISADTAFMLHDTCGVYIDIVEQMASERGINVDRGGFNTLMEAARERSRAAQKKRTVTAVQGDLPKTDDSLKYESLTAEARVLGWVEDSTVFSGGMLFPGKTVGLILDQTCFYAEQGGQVGDRGAITGGTGQFIVED